jgi:hypothetical protein
VPERIEYRGEWWVRDADQRWPGTLIRESDGDVAVNVYAFGVSPALYDLSQHFPVVHGMTVEGKPVTLTMVDAIATNIRFPGATETTLRPLRTFVGAWFQDDDDIVFDTLTVRLEGLDEWANITGLQRRSRVGARRDLSVDFEVPEDINLGSYDDVQMTLAFGAVSRPHGRPMTSVQLTQEARIELRCEKPQPYSKLEDVVRQVRNFMTFVARRQVELEFVRGFADARAQGADDGTTRRVPVDVFYRPIGDDGGPKRPLQPHRLLFGVTENGVDSDSHLSRWLALNESLGAVFDLYLVGLYQPRTFLELRFLTLVQAAESLHSHQYDTLTLPRDEHRRRVTAVVEAAPKDLREWARERLQGANRKSLRESLAELIRALPENVFDAIPDVDSFGEHVRLTRNYLTHWSSDLEGQAARGEDLVRLTFGLRCVLEALLLKEIGFTDSEVGALLERNEAFKQHLHVAFAPARA